LLVIVISALVTGVSCGIPDFRSRDGLYASLKDRGEYDLDDPQQMYGNHLLDITCSSFILIGLTSTIFAKIQPVNIPHSYLATMLILLQFSSKVKFLDVE
jgi:NAD-dependent SIR2 family protein deacetylase